MLTCLVAWELGGGFGHVRRLRPLVEYFAASGHRVVVAAKDVHKAVECFGNTATYLQAPLKPSGTRPYPQAVNHAQLLANIGFDSKQGLCALLGAWSHLYEYVLPDVILFDHSPTAMLAARRLQGVKRIVVGTGFEIPPDCSPFPVLRTWAEFDDEQLVREETDLLAKVNDVLSTDMTGQSLDRLSQIYDVDLKCLATVPILDPYQSNRRAEYIGPWPQAGATEPRWPQRAGVKVYCYLKPDRCLPRLLNDLVRRQLPTLISLDGDVRLLKQQFECETLKITGTGIDIRLASEQCDVAILSGGHDSTYSLLQVGKPCMFLPSNLEQLVTARSVVSFGAGILSDPQHASHAATQLDVLLHSNTLFDAASSLSAELSDYRSQNGQLNCQSQIQKLILS